MAQKFVIAEIIVRCGPKIKGWASHVVHSAAAQTTDVIVMARIAVKTALAASPLQLLNLTHAGQEVEVSIDSSQAEVWQPRPQKFVKLGGRRMKSQLAEHLEDYLPLPGISLKSVWSHTIPYCY